MVNLIQMFEISLKYFRIINYIISTLIIVSILLLARGIVNFTFSGNDNIVPSDAQGSPEEISFKKTDIMDYSMILEKNPFGPPMQLTMLGSRETPDTQYAPVSDLVLVGTAVGSRNPGYAVFIDTSQNSDGQQEVFNYGEPVFNYGRLVKINRSYVELERDSVTYQVHLKQDDTLPVERAFKKQLKSGKEDKKFFAKKVGERQYVLDSRKVQQSLENPERLLTDARLLPVIKDGKQEGFIISEVVPDGMYHSLGLKNGDTLLKINGLEISNPEVAIQAMSALKGMNSIDLDIIRDGVKMSLTYQIR